MMKKSLLDLTVKVLRLTALGMVIWAISLLWPKISEILAPKVADAVVIGLVVAVAAYMLGQQFRTQPRPAARGKEELSSSGYSYSTRPVIPVIYPFSRSPRPTQPIPALITSDLHTRLTRPMPVVAPHTHHARITRPMTIAMTR